jgi:hypothetical protein
MQLSGKEVGDVRSVGADASGAAEVDACGSNDLIDAASVGGAVVPCAFFAPVA